MQSPRPRSLRDFQIFPDVKTILRQMTSFAALYATNRFEICRAVIQVIIGQTPVILTELRVIDHFIARLTWCFGNVWKNSVQFHPLEEKNVLLGISCAVHERKADRSSSITGVVEVLEIKIGHFGPVWTASWFGELSSSSSWMHNVKMAVFALIDNPVFLSWCFCSFWLNWKTINFTRGSSGTQFRAFR